MWSSLSLLAMYARLLTEIVAISFSVLPNLSNKRAIPEVSLGKGLASANGTSEDASGAMKGKTVGIADLVSEMKTGLNVARISMKESDNLNGLFTWMSVKANTIKPCARDCLTS